MNEKKRHIDSQFIDHSWQEMTNLLDKEMPVKKKKRRFIWVWFISLSFLLLIAIRIWNFYENKMENDLPAPKIETKLPTEKIAKNAPSELPKNKEGTPNKKIVKSPNRTPKVKSFEKINYTKPSEEVAQATSSTDAFISKEEKITNQISIPTTPSSKENINLIPIIDPNKLLKQQIEEQKERKHLANFDFLPTLDFSLLKKDEIPIIIPYKIKKKPLIRWGIYAGAVSQKAFGYRTGIFASWQFHPKWAVFSGFGYANRVINTQKKSSNNEASSADLTPNTGLPAGDQENSPDPATSLSGMNMDSTELDLDTNFEMEMINNDQIMLQKMHYFELPILLQYQISPRVGIELGGQVSKLHRINYKLGSAEKRASGAYFASGESFNLSNTTRSSLIRPTISNWNVALLGGFNYKFTSSIQAYSNFHYGLKPYSQFNSAPLATNSTFADERLNNNQKWRQFEIGIRYYFK